MISQQVTKRNRCRMVMIASGVLLMRIGGIHRDSFIDPRIAIPNAVARKAANRGGILAMGVGIGKGIIGIEDSHPVYRHSDLAQLSKCMCGRNDRGGRNTINRFLVGRKVNKQNRARGSVVPWSHDMAPKASSPNIN